ncbi:MAG TPA: PIN domain-containing protein [Tepidisphaeraceae bacterium]|jgi:predicted nucleic acid-binding protein
MSERRLVDTNLIVRHLVHDHEKHSKAAAKLIDACDRGEVTLILLPVVLAECVFVLGSFYERSRHEIAKVLHDLVSSPGVELDQPAIHVDALRRYGESKLHFVDCLIAAHAAAGDIPVATFDSDFEKFSDVRVENE